MGKVIPINRARRPKLETPGLAVDEPKVRALAQLAETLRNKKLKESDRAQVARNWHEILKELKNDHGIRKETVYEVLQGSNSTDSALKKSLNYEIRPGMEGEVLAKRITKLTQSGDKWLKLAERAADLTRMGRHDLLPNLLKGTSIAPPTTTPPLETPDPIASLLQLANAACAKIASQIDLKGYFADWSRNWVQYRSKDGAFLPEPLAEIDNNDWVAPMGRQAFELSEELSDRSFITGMPLPYVAFGWRPRFSFQARVEPDSKSDIDEAADWIVEVTYVREFGLAIAVNAYDGTIAPALEVRHFPVLTNTATQEQVPFWPICGFPDAPGFFDEYHSCKDWAEVGEGEIYAGRLEGELGLAGRQLWVSLVPQMTADDLERKEEACARVDRSYPERRSELESHYSLLTPRTVEALNVWCEAVRELGDRRTLTESSGQGLRILEAMLLEGTADGSLFDLLLKDATTKSQGFRQAYDIVLRRVQEDHRNALAEFGYSKREHD